jgi:hypothetical protein
MRIILSQPVREAAQIHMSRYTSTKPLPSSRQQVRPAGTIEGIPRPGSCLAPWRRCAVARGCGSALRSASLPRLVRSRAGLHQPVQIAGQESKCLPRQVPLLPSLPRKLRGGSGRGDHHGTVLGAGSSGNRPWSTRRTDHARPSSRSTHWKGPSARSSLVEIMARGRDGFFRQGTTCSRSPDRNTSVTVVIPSAWWCADGTCCCCAQRMPAPVASDAGNGWHHLTGAPQRGRACGSGVARITHDLDESTHSTMRIRGMAHRAYPARLERRHLEQRLQTRLGSLLDTARRHN